MAQVIGEGKQMVACFGECKQAACGSAIDMWNNATKQQHGNYKGQVCWHQW